VDLDFQYIRFLPPYLIEPSSDCVSFIMLSRVRGRARASYCNVHTLMKDGEDGIKKFRVC
jgi:hypothetical protein